jgi:NhaA family Na+:H+ antiporter
VPGSLVGERVRRDFSEDSLRDGFRDGLLRRARDGRAPGITMTVATAAALVWANVAAGSYRDTWHHLLSIPGLRLAAQEWVNQGLMVAFFALVGLEIRREVSGGELRTWSRAAVPVGAALGGMAVPALVYAAVLHGNAGSRGWGIPMATDVAFALGALALVATGASRRLRVFLLTLAVADDIGSIAILVCFYSREVRLWSLLGAGACLAAMVGVRVSRTRARGLLVVLAALAWWALVHAGVEASVVGVAVGMLVPPTARTVRSWEHRLEPWVNVVVLPVFALANVGVTLAGSRLFSRGALGVFIAVLLARAVGKPIGIAGTAWALTRGGHRHDRIHLDARDRVGLGAFAAVGFTVPLLIVRAALPAGPLAAAATVGLLVGSGLGVIGGAVVMRHT